MATDWADLNKADPSLYTLHPVVVIVFPVHTYMLGVICDVVAQSLLLWHRDFFGMQHPSVCQPTNLLLVYNTVPSATVLWGGVCFYNFC